MVLGKGKIDSLGGGARGKGLCVAAWARQRGG